MSKLVTINDVNKVVEDLKLKNQKIVLVGGCFDILHIGHIRFLENSKKEGDTVIVLLESDEQVKKTKGDNRPIHTQEQRAEVLAALSVVSYIILLPSHFQDSDYDNLVRLIKPAIIATTQADPGRFHKERQAEGIGARVVDVVDRIGTHATSKVAELLSKEL